MFDEISKSLDVECIETEYDGLGLPSVDESNVFDVVNFDVIDDNDIETITPKDKDDESLREEIRKKVFKNMASLVDSAMSALPHVIKEVKFTDDNKVFTSASNFIVTVAKLNEQYLGMANEIGNENKGLKDGIKKVEKVETHSTVTNNIIMTADDLFSRLGR